MSRKVGRYAEEASQEDDITKTQCWQRRMRYGGIGAHRRPASAPSRRRRHFRPHSYSNFLWIASRAFRRAGSKPRRGTDAEKRRKERNGRGEAKGKGALVFACTRQNRASRFQPPINKYETHRLNSSPVVDPAHSNKSAWQRFGIRLARPRLELPGLYLRCHPIDSRPALSNSTRRHCRTIATRPRALGIPISCAR